VCLHKILEKAGKVDKTMKKKLLSLPILLLLTFSILAVLNFNPIQVSAVEYPAIYIEPATIVDPNLTPGNNFTVSIKTNYTGSDIIAYEFTLSYNPNVIHGIEVTNGDLITTDKHPSAMFLPGTFNNTAGTLSITGAVFFFVSKPAPLTSGPGTLANVNFTVVGNGASDITIGPLTKLIGYTDDGWGDPYDIIAVTFSNTDTWTGDGVTNEFNTTQAPVVPESEYVFVNDTRVDRDENYTIDYITGEITFYIAPDMGAKIKAVYQYLKLDHKLQHGIFSNIPLTHDVAVSLVVPDEAIVGQLVPINVTVENKGTYPEDVTLTVVNATKGGIR